MVADGHQSVGWAAEQSVQQFLFNELLNALSRRSSAPIRSVGSDPVERRQWGRSCPGATGALSPARALPIRPAAPIRHGVAGRLP
jgi:hypothetical protein